MPASIHSLHLPQVRLEITRGRVRQRFRVMCGPVFLIGSSPDCDLVLADRQFPAVHCYLFRSRQGLLLKRLEGGPQMVIGGRPASSARLSGGERLKTGPYEFRFHVAAAASPPVLAFPGRLTRPEQHGIETLLEEIDHVLFPASVPSGSAGRSEITRQRDSA